MSVSLCLGITRRISRSDSRRSRGSRALRKAASAALYSGVRLAGMVVSATPSKPATYRRRSRSRKATRLFYRHVGAGSRGGCSPRWGGGSTHASSVTLSMLGLVSSLVVITVGFWLGAVSRRGFHAPSA
jgi:hypothetical protein